MRKRRKLTPKDTLNKECYRGILWLIHLYQHNEIKFLHLRYRLVKNHNIALNSKLKKELDDFFKDERVIVPHPEWFEKKIEGKRGINNLSNFLSKLIELNMIEKYKEKDDRFPSYRLTDFGYYKLKRWYIKSLIDMFVPDEKLDNLSYHIGTIMAEEAIKN